jgi:hypothetical protein
MKAGAQKTDETTEAMASFGAASPTSVLTKWRHPTVAVMTLRIGLGRLLRAMQSPAERALWRECLKADGVKGADAVASSFGRRLHRAQQAAQSDPSSEKRRRTKPLLRSSRPSFARRLSCLLPSLRSTIARRRNVWNETRLSVVAR